LTTLEQTMKEHFNRNNKLLLIYKSMSDKHPAEQEFTNPDEKYISQMSQYKPEGERKLSSLLPITKAVVSHPFVKESMFNNYMVYKVVFKFNDTDQEINRRFSDFDSLRKAIKMFRPFNYIYPVHRKQFIGTVKPEFIKDRIEELNNFINYILSKPEIFNIGCLIRPSLRLLQPQFRSRQNRRCPPKGDNPIHKRPDNILPRHSQHERIPED